MNANLFCNVQSSIWWEHCFAQFRNLICREEKGGMAKWRVQYCRDSSRKWFDRCSWADGLEKRIVGSFCLRHNCVSLIQWLNGTSYTHCPLCKDADSLGNILGSCTHSEVRKVYISRHDKAMRLIMKETQNGSLRSSTRQTWERLWH
jgi:hypothetical protein